MIRNIFLNLRITPDEADFFNQRAQDLNVSVSQRIRDTALNGPISVTVDKSQAGFEFRRTGALLKHLYPARDQRWTAEDKKQWWALVQNLRDRADTLESMAIVNNPTPFPPSNISTCAPAVYLNRYLAVIESNRGKMMTAIDLRSAFETTPARLVCTSPVRGRGRPRKTTVAVAAVSV